MYDLLGCTQLPGKILHGQKNWNPLMFDYETQAKVSLI